MDFSHGKQKVKTSGIMEFGVSRDQFEPNVFYTWERYDSNGSLGRHNTCPEFQAFMENVCFLLIVSAPVSIHCFHALGPHVVFWAQSAGTVLTWRCIMPAMCISRKLQPRLPKGFTACVMRISES